MIHLKKRLSLAALIIVLSCGHSVAQQIAPPTSPRTLSYQGVISEKGGVTNLAGTHLVTVTLYSDNMGTQKLWQSTMTTTLDTSGVFSTLLGTPENPLPDAQTMDRPIFLGVSLDGQPEMRPLTTVSASAYALNVADNSITSNKIAAGAVTADKLNMDYVSSISVNGEKVTTPGTGLNITGGNGVNVSFDPGTNSLQFHSQGSENKGKGSDGPLTTYTQIAVTDAGATAYTSGPTGTTTTVLHGNASGLPSYGAVNLATDVSGTLPIANGGTGGTTGFWLLGGNTTSSVQVLGTVAASTAPNWTENIAGKRIVLFQDVNFLGSDNIPDIIGGAFDNAIDESTAGIGPSGGNFIGGGGNNNLDQNEIFFSHFATIGGGLGNRINFEFSTDSINNLKFQVIAGGEKNHAVRKWSSITGGQFNEAIGEYSTIGGGLNNLIDTVTEYSTVGGGRVNWIHDSYGFIGGGDTNLIDFGAPYSDIGGGRRNYIQGPYSAIAGGDSNRITAIQADHNFIGGGLRNIENNPSFGVIGGGWQNLLDYDAWGSLIGSGDSNIIRSQLGVIGGGRYNLIQFTWDYASTIGGGQRNTISNGTFSFIGGGDSNSINTNSATISGGYTNTITSGGPYAAIPGGDSLKAQSFAQTVTGYNNKPLGAFIEGMKNDFASNPTHANDPLFIIGNGNNPASQSNAFQVSYDGHTTVFDKNGSGGATIGGGSRPAIYGSTYQDNIVYAW
ncbi:MAG TPA: hypothetical protein VG537_10940, partial [Candidatus Kapabacteria bacterium]|nr:hypothetical protein [Candidatus Kapabacteria bacterium]